MNRVATRSLILLVLVLGLLVGTGFFVGEYFAKSGTWVMSAGSPHVDEDTGISLGYMTDRDGQLLLAVSEQRTYHNANLVRRASLHWTGDRAGNIPSNILTHYTKELLDYSALTGTYHYGDTVGRLETTLDSIMQATAQEAMGDLVGTIAVFNYETGEIVCAVSTPNFDPDDVPDIDADTSGQYEGVYVNRFIRAKYIPGSIFKIVTLAAALESIPDIQDQRFSCTGSCEAGSGVVTCEDAHGDQSLKDAFCNSCNCAFAQITLQLGKDRMNYYVEKFGLLEAVSFDGLTTVKGNYDVSQAGTESFAWSGIGQYTDQINPCAFLRFVGAIANGGVPVQPYLVSSVSVGAQVTYRAQVQKLDRIITPATAQVLTEYMANNVTAKYGAYRFPNLSVCGKSGTGEVGGGKRPNAMFAGFLTDSDLPLAFIACVENGGYGASVCIPILNEVLQSASVLSIG